MLSRPIGGPAVMRAQLEHLIASAQTDHVEVRLLSLRTGAHASLAGAFRIVEMPEPYPQVAHMDTPAGSIYVEAGRAEKLASAYDQMWAAALNADESAELLSIAAEGFT